MNQLFLGFYFGSLFIILIYNLQWYINTKEKSYIYYIFMQLSMILIFLHIADIFTTSLILNLLLVMLFSYLFVRDYLNLNSNVKPDIYITLFSYAFILFCVIIYVFNFDYIFNNIPFFLFYIPFLLIAFSKYKKGLVIAKYFLLGWGIYVAFIFIAFVLKINDVDILLRNYLIQIGNIIEAVVLSFALSLKTKMIMREQKEQEEMLIHQSRLASMGEMLVNISHQWRQPLNRIASFIMNMQIHIMENYKNEKFLLDKLEESQQQLEYMSSTIDDFSNFYKTQKTKEDFLVSESIDNAHNIIKSSLTSNNIQIEVSIINDFKILAYPKELSQVILNLLQNAKDALVVNDIKNPVIQIIIDSNKISIQDNADGIPQDIINRIFDPYFTTKENHDGTGVGLYMSKMILEKDFDAKISVVNQNNGACFIITFT